MDIKRSCALSPFIDTNKPIISTPQTQPLPTFSFESNDDNICGFNSISQMNIDTPSSKADFLDEQFRLERDIAEQTSIKTEDSFTTTYSSLQMIICQMQIKLASAFLQETEYLKQREQRLDQDQQSLTKRIKQLKNIQIEREELEKEFSKLKDRLETAIIHLTKFQTDGEQTLRTLFSESHQIDEQLSGLLSQSLDSLTRSRTIINSKINQFILKSDHIQSELIDREILMDNTQLSIKLIIELVNILNQINIEHSQDIIMTNKDLEKYYQQFIQTSQATKNYWNIQKEIEEIRLFEHEKIQLEKELLEQTILLENIYTILGKTII